MRDGVARPGFRGRKSWRFDAAHSFLLDRSAAAGKGGERRAAMDFCPACGMLLQIQPATGGHRLRLFCPTCPYVCPIKNKIVKKARLAKREVESTESAPKTEAEPKETAPKTDGDLKQSAPRTEGT